MVICPQPCSVHEDCAVVTEYVDGDVAVGNGVVAPMTDGRTFPRSNHFAQLPLWLNTLRFTACWSGKTLCPQDFFCVGLPK